jgi:hypothetical protein
VNEPQVSRGERIVCWVGNFVAVAYLVWLAAVLSWINPKYAVMYESMALQLSGPTAFVVRNGGWLYPCVFGLLAAFVLGKDMFLRDKRLSVVVAFVVAIGAQFVAHGFFVLYFLPMFDLIDKLAGQ